MTSSSGNRALVALITWVWATAALAGPGFIDTARVTGDASAADVEVRLVDAARPEGEPLWAGRLEQKLRGYPYANQYTNQNALIQRLCDDYAAEVLGALPARKASPERP